MLFPIILFAQEKKVTLSGFVREKGSLETLPGVSVFLPDLKKGMAANNYGFYAFTISPGTYTIEVSFVGYKKQSLQVILNEDVKLDIELENDGQLDEVVVVASEQKKISENTRMSTIDIPINQIKDIPALLGEKDVFKVIKLLPGVQKGVEGSSGFYVRGGGADQNLIILDDAVVYNANHLFGFFSIFNGDALKSVELIKGGFPARYGERLSSVLVMNMKEGNKENFTGEAGLGLLSSRITLEGPIQKNKSSFLVSGRRTYFDLLAKPFMPEDMKVGYYFYDLNAKMNFDLNAANKIFVSGYFGRDKFNVKDKYDGGEDKQALIWGNATVTTRWNHLFSNKVFANTSLIFSDYNLLLKIGQKYKDEFYEAKYNSGIRDLGMKFDLDYAVGGDHYLRSGVKSVWHQFTPSALVEKGNYNNVNTRNVKVYNSYETNIYVEDDWIPLEKLSFNIGLRSTNFSADGHNYKSIEPRLSARFSINPNTSVKASYARMNQYLHLLSNTGVGLPTDLWVPSTAKIVPERSQQVAIGIARDFPEKKLLFSVEGYYKTMNNIISYREGASFIETGDSPKYDESMNFEDKITTGKGKSYGLEMLLQRKSGRLSGWIGYTLSWTKHQFGELNSGKEFYPRQDHRHDFSLVAIYKLSKRVKLTGSCVFSSGASANIPQAQYSVNSHGYVGNSYSAIHAPFKGEHVNRVNDYGERGSFKTEPYHRLDLGVQFYKKKKRVERTIEIGVYNAYNHLNPFYYTTDFKENDKAVLKKVAIFPIIPSVSWNYKF